MTPTLVLCDWNIKIDCATKRQFDIINAKLRVVLDELIFGERKWPLYIHGSSGVGKTAAALALADKVFGSVFFKSVALNDAFRVAMLEGYDIKRLTAYQFEDANLIPLITAKTETVNEEGLLEYLTTTPLLVIDDFCMSHISEYQYKNLISILDAREHKPTIMTSNVHPCKVFPDGIDSGRFLSRIYAGTVFLLDGLDLRLQK
jgi:DNA replication protein DnaC